MGLFSETESWVKAGKLKNLAEKSRFVYKEKAYALFRTEDGVYALDDMCSHEHSLLSEGALSGMEITCPKHGSRFSIKDGKALNLPAVSPVKTYETKVEKGAVYIKL